MSHLQDNGAVVYANGSNTPTPGDVASTTPATNPSSKAAERAASTPLPPIEKRRKQSRASTLLSTLAPPFSRRLGRARSLVAANGRPVLDVQEVVRESLSKERDSSPPSQSIYAENTRNDEATAPHPNGDRRMDDLERSDTMFGDGEFTSTVRKLSRRFSDAGVRRVGSAIGSFKRRMGLRHHDEDASTSRTNTPTGERPIIYPQSTRNEDEGDRQRTSLSPPKDLAKAARRTSFRDRFLKSRAPATDTFDFAATYSSLNVTDGNMKDDQSGNPVFVDSPVTMQEQEGNVADTKPPSTASVKPCLLHTESAPSQTSIRSKRTGHKVTVPPEPARTPASDFGPLDDITVPQQWIRGTEMLKVSVKGKKIRKVILDPDQGFILWESKKSGIIRIENIKEIRVGSAARYNMEQLGHPETDENRWLIISYLADGKYKALHLVALTLDDFNSFYKALNRLRELRVAMLLLPSHSHLPSTPHIEVPESPSNGNADPNSPHPPKPKLSKLLPVHAHSLHKHLTNQQRQNLWERHYWKGADLSADGRVDFKEIKRMAHRLSIGMTIHELEHLFKVIHLSGGAGMTLEEFRTFWRRLNVRADIQLLWRKLLVDEKLSFNVFERFMRKEQKDTRSTEELERVFLHYASTASDNHVQGEDRKDSRLSTSFLSLEGFTAYLMSSDNAPFSDQYLGVHQDMTRPLSEYYISSSHNTYLIGNQLVGDSTIEGYIRALLHSCRCVEIDIYDGDKEPVITHGGTLTSKIPLRVICEAIEKSAFVASPYPVIISAEVHCGVAQQDAIARIMKEVFGDKLIDRRVGGEDPLEPLKELPSPEVLMNKVLLKTKNPTTAQGNVNVVDVNVGPTIPVLAAETDGGTSTGITSDPEISPPERKGSFGLSRRRGSRSHSFSAIRPTGIAQADQDVPSDPFESKPPNTPKIKVFSQTLGGLLVYTVGVKFRGINKKERYAVEHMFSLSEKKTDKMLKEGGVSYAGDSSDANGGGVSGGMLDLIKHTQTHLVRTYPKGTRLKSTNYLPHRYWAAGAQLVAINWQTSDLGCMINHAMFLRNGKAGYVLKPASLRPSQQKIKEVVCRRKTYELDVKIISAQQIPRPRDKEGRDIIDKSTMDPYVQVALYVPDWPGAPKAASSQGDKEQSSSQIFAPGSSPVKSSNLRGSMDQARPNAPPRYVLQMASTPAKVVRAQTDAVKNNGFNPAWQRNLKLKFEVAGDMLDLVFIRFCVKDEGDAEDERALAIYCISLGSLKQGYRHLPLHDQQMSQYLFATLFVHTNLRQVN